MLATVNRLCKKQDIARVLRQGRFIGAEFFTLKFLGNNLDASRFCFVVSSKVAKQATQRNLIKRRLRHVVRDLLPQIKLGYDIVILTQATSKEAPYAQLRDVLLGALKKTKLID